MNISYVIQWKSKVNGRAGRGTKRFEKEEADRLVEELNREYPEIEHASVPAAEEPAAAESPVPSSPEPALSLA